MDHPLDEEGPVATRRMGKVEGGGSLFVQPSLWKACSPPFLRFSPWMQGSRSYRQMSVIDGAVSIFEKAAAPLEQPLAGPSELSRPEAEAPVRFWSGDFWMRLAG